MSFFNDNKVYIIGAVLIIIIIMYYLIDYQIRTTLWNELKKIGDKKNKKLKIQKIKQQKMAQMKQRYVEEQDQEPQYDMDSYVDPAAKYVRHDEEDDDQMPQERLSKDNIYMRDLMDK
jgi:hypothetical protein